MFFVLGQEGEKRRVNGVWHCLGKPVTYCLIRFISVILGLMTLCEQILQRWPLRAMAARLGLELPRDGVKFPSPFRPDQHPSCTVRGERFFDWSREPRGLDAIGLYALAKGLDPRAAITELARELPGRAAREAAVRSAVSSPGDDFARKAAVPSPALEVARRTRRC